MRSPINLRSAPYILPIAFAFYLIVMFPLLKEIIFTYDNFYHIWHVGKILEDPRILLKPNFMGRFSPLGELLFLPQLFFGFNPLVYGLINGSLHLLNAFLLFRLSRRLTSSSGTAAILSCLVFLFSSTQWETFGDTSQTGRLACSSLLLSSLLFFLKFITGEKKRDWVFSLFFFISSLGILEDAVTLPLLLLVMLFLIPPRRIPWSEKLIWTGPFFFVSLIVVLLLFSTKAHHSYVMGVGPHIAANYVYLVRDLVLFLLVPRPEFVPVSGIAGVLLRLVPALLIFSFVGIVFYWKKAQILDSARQSSVGRFLIFAIAWIGITTLPYSLRLMYGVWRARYFYLPAMGEAMVVGTLLCLVGRFLNVSQRGLSVAKGGFVALVLYGLVLNISTTFLMVNKARAGITAATQEEIPVLFSMVSAIKDQYGEYEEIPPDTLLMVEGLPFSISRLRELLPTYYISPPSLIIEARGGRPLEDFPAKENQQFLYLRWENQTFSAASIQG